VKASVHKSILSIDLINEQNVPMEADQIVDPPPPKQMRKISVQAGNGEDIIDNYLNTLGIFV
jgi:hypothetical protein